MSSAAAEMSTSWISGSRLAAVRRQDGELLAAAAAELHDAERPAQRLENRLRVRREQRRFRARDAIPRQAADRFEERRPELVVEVFRRELPRRALQVLAHLGGETCHETRQATRAACVRSSRATWQCGTWRRRRDSGAGTSCGSRAGRGRAPSPATRLSSRSDRRRRSRRSTPGYEAIGANPSNGANTVEVHSQPLPTRSWTPKALAPSGCAPTGSGSQRTKSKFAGGRLFELRRPTDSAVPCPRACRTRHDGTRAPVGSRRPRQRAYAFASAHVTYTGQSGGSGTRSNMPRQNSTSRASSRLELPEGRMA